VAGAAVTGALASGAWAGALRFEAAGVRYAGALRLVDVDDDARVVGAHAQARATRGWAGVTAAIAARVGERDTYTLDADVRLSGDATDAAGQALLAAVRARLDAAGGAAATPADDPAWRRKLALRAALAVGVGVAAGLAGAAWDRRRRT
jgi:hypothetical protein